MKEWGDRKTREEQFQEIKARAERGIQQDSRGCGVRLLAAGDSRSRHLGRIHLHSRGPVGRRREVPVGQRESVYGRGAQAPGDRQR